MKASLSFFFVSLFILSSCSSGLKKRQEQREKVAASSGLFCEFVSGDDHKDVDVELNLSMAKRCDVNKNFTVTGYKSSSEINGLVYCCAMKRPEARPTPVPTPTRPAAAAPAAPRPKAETTKPSETAPVLAD